MQKERTALITGANSGIGLALTQKLINEGYHVIGTSRSGKIDDFSHQNLTVLPLDITCNTSIGQLASRLDKENHSIDLLVNNSGTAAGVYSIVPERESFDENIAINLTGNVFFTEAVVDRVNDGGQVVFISTDMGLLKKAGPNGVGYRVSKAGITMYAGILAQRLMEKNIRVTPMHPGWVKTRIGGDIAPLTAVESAEALYHGITTNTETGKFWNSALRGIEE